MIRRWLVMAPSEASEKAIRQALRQRVLTTTVGAQQTVDEFWVPRSHERADIAVIGKTLDGFEIKSSRDTLARLPRQVSAYGRIFDRCVAVVAERHLDQAIEWLPEWWGLLSCRVNGRVVFDKVRGMGPNPGPDAETLVRLLWRKETMGALIDLGDEPDPRASRNSLWEALLAKTTLQELRAVVRTAILERDPAKARIRTRRFRVLLEAPQ